MARISVVQRAETPTPIATPTAKTKPTIGGTIKNATTIVGKAVLNKAEQMGNAILQFATSKANPFNPYEGDKLKGIQSAAQNIIKANKTQELLDKVGYSKVNPTTGKTFQQELEEKSAIKSTGFGGQILSGIGEQLPNIVLGNMGAGKAAQIAGSTIPLAASAYGGGVQEAYQSGANRQQANLYGGLNTAVELATEYITGGVPGVETGFLSGIDKLASKGINKVSNAITRSLLDAGYKVVGEGFEEALAEIMNPLIKNVSYTKGEKVNWKNVINSAVQGAILGGLLNAPSTISNVNNAVQQQNIIKQQNNAQIQTNAPTNTITPTTPQTTQGAAQIQSQGQVMSTQPQIEQNIQDTTQQGTTKQRGVYSTALQNQNIPAEIKSGIKNLNQDYIVITDEDALSKAQQKLTDNGADKSLELFKNKFDNNEKLSKYDIAEATLLYNDAFAKGDTQKALDILTSIAVAGTESGQVSQATSILQRTTPDGRLLALQKQVNKINQERNTDLKLNEEDANNIKNAQNQEELDNAVNKAIENVSQQIPKTFKETLREWRYLAMLGNPKTHIRNVVSNVAMKGTGKVKNLLSSTLQDIFLDETQKTRTTKKSSQEVINFSKQDAETQKARIQGSDKYDLGKGKIKPAQSKLSAFNSNALEFEDWLFSSSAYSNALSNYITAQNLDINNITPQQLETARQYAVDQAQELTFRKASKIANAISQFEKKNIATEILVGSTLPFKTTPINIAKTGVEYSPVGLIKTITKNTYDLKQGKISPSTYIDNLSKGLTGTGISLVGYLLAEMGLLTASGSDEDKEKYFQQMQGKQPYSIRVGNTTITLDWLSPSAMPFFMGAEISEMKKNGTSDDKLLNIASGLATIVDPLTEMSMLQGLNKTLKSYKDNALGGVLVNTLENYALQYIPTISGQVARTFTPDRKSTTGGGTGVTKEFNTFLNKAKAKIPVLANTLEPYTDQFGNKEITKNIAERAFQNFLSPAYIKGVKTDKVYEEIQKLYDRTGETSILPTSSSRYFTKNGEKIYLTPEEYTKFNQIDGKQSFADLSYFFNSETYKQMNDEERVKAIESFYRASQAIAKERYNK